MRPADVHDPENPLTVLSMLSFQPQRWSAGQWIAVLVFVSLLALLPGFFALPPVDRDETRFAQSTRQMTASGDYIDIPFQDGKRYKKPIGIYWLQALGTNGYRAATGGEAPIWVYRIPSLAGVLAAVVATFWMARAFLTPYGAGIAGLMMAISILPGVEARIAKTDGMLLFVIVAAHAVLARVWKDGADRPLSGAGHLIFWGALGAGVLLKGPIVLLVCGLTLGALTLTERSFFLLRKLRPLSGLFILFLIAAPWFSAIGIKSGGAFFLEAGLNDFLGKAVSVKESHGGPPGLYAAATIATFWPASLVFIAAVPFLRRDWNARAVLFSLAWLVPNWLLFEFVPTKLPHYVLPLYPAIALLIGYALQNRWHVTARWQKIVLMPVFIVPSLLVILGFGALLYLEGVASPFVVFFGIAAAAAGVFAWRELTAARDVGRALVPLTFCAVSIYAAIYQFAFPRLDTVWISNRLIAALGRQEHAQNCPAPSVISVGYSEPSLAFLGPLDLRFETPRGAAEKLEEAPCRLLFLAKGEEASQFAELKSRDIALIPLETVSGRPLNGGRKVTITLYRTRPDKGEE